GEFGIYLLLLQNLDGLMVSLSECSVRQLSFVIQSSQGRVLFQKGSSWPLVPCGKAFSASISSRSPSKPILHLPAAALKSASTNCMPRATAALSTRRPVQCMAKCQTTKSSRATSTPKIDTSSS